eukprot:SAG22_NODE_745_length_7499_cov_2.796622_6_plen_81_part_00
MLLARYAGFVPSGAATGRLQPQLIAYCWCHTACGVAEGGVDPNVAEVGLEDIDITGSWKREMMDPGMKLQLALSPAAFAR